VGRLRVERMSKGKKIEKAIKLKPSECPHCKFMLTLGEIQTNREHWLITEMFVYLHNGKCYCDWGK